MEKKTTGTWVYLENRLIPNQIIITNEIGNILIARVLSEDTGIEEAIANADTITTAVNSYDTLKEENERLKADKEVLIKALQQIRDRDMMDKDLAEIRNEPSCWYIADEALNNIK